VIRSFVNGDDKFKKSLASNTTLFVNYVTEELSSGSTVGLRWGILIFRFEWKVAILELLKSKGLDGSMIDDSVMDEVMGMTKEYPLKFNTELVERMDLATFSKESFVEEIQKD
jgi:hypothetical protein